MTSGPADRLCGAQPRLRLPCDLTPSEAVAFQNEMRSRVVVGDGPQYPTSIAGGDVAYDEETGRCFAAVVVMAASAAETIEQVTAEADICFPYVPGLLAFREGPALLAAFERLHHRPEVIIFDGHGVAHPRRCGLATHLGYVLDIPSIGCAKSLFVGRHGKIGIEAGSFSWLLDGDERVGAALRTRTGGRPIYVSPGHRVGFDAAVRLVLASVTDHRLPEPVRLANVVAERLKREHRQNRR